MNYITFIFFLFSNHAFATVLDTGVYDKGESTNCSLSITYRNVVDQVEIRTIDKYNGTKCDEKREFYILNCTPGKAYYCVSRTDMFSIFIDSPNQIRVPTWWHDDGFDADTYVWKSTSSPQPTMFRSVVGFGWSWDSKYSKKCDLPDHKMKACENLTLIDVNPLCARLKQPAEEKSLKDCQADTGRTCQIVSSISNTYLKRASQGELASGCEWISISK